MIRDVNSLPAPLQRLVRWAERQETVRAVLLTGSRSSEKASLDRFSDYDVILYVTDLERFLRPEWLTTFGSVLVRYEERGQEPGGLPYAMQLALYEDGSKIDFSITCIEALKRVSLATALPEELDLGCEVLLDKDGLSAGLPSPSYRAYVITKPTEPEFLAVVEEFFWETTYVAKNLWRDELLPAKYSLEVVLKLGLLRRMLEWRVAMGRDWSVRFGVLGRGLKRQLDERTWAELESTFVGADAAENWAALFRALQLFRRIARELAVGLCYAYPEALDVRVTRYLEEVRAASHGHRASPNDFRI
ncbi:MAG: aminoglycoside 6-adenylyltransferase [Longimicrobiales bacterium]